MNAFLFTIVAALCAQSIYGATPYDFGGVYATIANETASALANVAVDASPIVSAVQRSTVAGATAIDAYYTSTIAQLQPSKQKAVAGYVAQLTKAQQAQSSSCTNNYTSQITLFTSYYSNNVINCLNLRFGLPLLESVQNVQAYTKSEVVNLYGDLSTASAGGLAYAPAFVTASADTLSRTIDATVELGWARQALSYLICLTANDEEAQQALALLLNKINNCLPLRG